MHQARRAPRARASRSPPPTWTPRSSGVSRRASATGSAEGASALCDRRRRGALDVFGSRPAGRSRRARLGSVRQSTRRPAPRGARTRSAGRSGSPSPKRWRRRGRPPRHPRLVAGNELARTGDLAPANVRLQQAGVLIERRSIVRAVRATESVDDARPTHLSRSSWRTASPASAATIEAAARRRRRLPAAGRVALGRDRTHPRARRRLRRPAHRSTRRSSRAAAPPLELERGERDEPQTAYLCQPAAARPGHRRQPHRVLRPPHELRRGRPADRAARRLLRGAGRGRRRADHHRGALDPPDRLALREADPRLPPRRASPATGASPTPCTATARRSSPRSTTTAARRRRCTPACRCGRRRRWPTRCSARCPRRSTHAEIAEIVAGYALVAEHCARGRLRRHRAAVLALARSCAASCRRPRTSAPTTTAARSTTGPGCCSRSSPRCARRSAATWRSACGSAATS